MIPDIERLIDLARSLTGQIVLARPDMSAATCASAILGSDGNTYTGICVHVSCGIGFCAEHAAIAEMIKGRETQIQLIVTVREDGTIMSPCGRCREFMAQVNPLNLNARVVLSRHSVVTLRELLPVHWLEPPG